MIFTACLLVYLNSLHAPFLWDDYGLIRDNAFVKSWSHLGDIFRSHFGEGSYEGDVLWSYRPVTTVSFLVDHTLWGNAPFGYRLTNFLLHFFNCLLLYGLVSLLANRPSAFLTAFFFGIHPIHTEAVTYISSRGDLLYSFFILWGLYFFIQWRKTPRFLSGAGSAFCFLLSLFSKEPAVIFPFLLLGYTLCFQSPTRRREFAIEFAFFVFLGCYLFFRFFAIPLPPVMVKNFSFFAWKTLTAAPLLFSYLKILLWPFPLYVGRSAFRMNSHSPPDLFLTAALCWAALCFLVLISRKHSGILFGILWVLIGCVPLLNLFYGLYPTMAEHYFYLPSMGVFALAGTLGEAGYRKLAFHRRARTGIQLFGIGLSLVLGTLTFLRNAEYQSPWVFYTQTIRYAPDSWRIRTLLGIYYQQRGFFQKAKKEFIKSVKLNPENSTAAFHLGAVYFSEGHYEKALSNYQKALAADPASSSLYHLWSAHALFRLGKVKEAMKNVSFSLKDPSLRDRAYNLLGIMAYERGQWEEAVRQFHRSLQANPRNSEAHRNLGVLYYRQGRLGEARDHLESSKRLEPGNRKTELFLKQLEAAPLPQ